MIKLSVIIPYTKSNDEFRELNLQNTVYAIQAQKMPNYELILVEELIDTKESTLNPNVKSACHKHIILHDKRKFNKSWCINVGFKEASCDKVVVIDADCTFGQDYFDKVLETARANIDFFNGYNVLICMSGRDNPNPRTVRHNHIHAVGGSWFSDRKFFFEQTGGMNETFFGYGGEDNDMWERVKFCKGFLPDMEYTIYHQYHHWHPSNSNFPLNPLREKLFLYTKKNPKLIIDMIKATGVGNKEHPSPLTVIV